MARSGRARSAGVPADARRWSSAFVREAVGVLLLGLAVFSAIALWSYAATDPLWSTEKVANRAGRLGALVAAGLNGSVGVAAYLLVVLVAAVGARLLAGFGMPPASSRLTLAIPLLLLPATTLPPLLGAAMPRFAGLHGGAVGR